jgi:hypothetical protein
MASGIGGKIHAIVKVVRRVQTFSATTAAIGIGSIMTLFFLPVDVTARIVLFIPGLLFFSRKVFVFVYARQAAEQLEFEARYVAENRRSDDLAESLTPSSKLWSRSAIVRSVRATDYRPRLDPVPNASVARRLERHLIRQFASMMLPRAGIDHALLVVWIGVWIYFAVVAPESYVVAATVLFASGLALFFSLIWLELAFNLAIGEQRHRLFALYWELAEWMIDRFVEMKKSAREGSGYSRTEHFRESPWFSEKPQDRGSDLKNAGGPL